MRIENDIRKYRNVLSRVLMRCMCLFQHMFTGIDKDGDKCITKAEFMTEMMKPSRS